MATNAKSYLQARNRASAPHHTEAHPIGRDLSKTHRVTKAFLCLLAPLFCAFGVSGQANAPRSKEIRVLFIGNSFTFGNDVPAIVAALAAAGGQRCAFEAVTFPDMSLEDHWEKGEAQRKISRGKWDIVVLQQGPSGLEESRRMLLDYTRRFDKLIRAAGAKPALYMVWPSRQRFGDFDRVVESYKLAAAEVQGLVLPVGQAWREAWKLDAQLPLYGPDNFHPSVAGSYLAALVMYQKFFGQSPVGLPSRLKLRSSTLSKIELPEAQARMLQAAADAANKLY